MRSLPRFGGWNPLKVFAVLAAVFAGGVVAFILGSILMMILTIVGFATTGVGWLLTYGWIIAAYLIYRAVRRQQSDEDYSYEYREHEWEHDEEEREHEYQRRVADLRTRAQSGPALTQRPDTRPERRSSDAGTVALAVIAGLVLAALASVGLGGLNLSPLATRLLPTGVGAVVGVGVYAALRRWVMAPIDDEKPPAKQVRKQIARIRSKARKLGREGTKAGGVFAGLDVQADRLAAEASELADRLLDLRRIARDVRREFGNPAKSDGVPPDAPDPRVRSALREAQEAQKRLDTLLSRNRAAQQQCLAQIERIEDLLDVARLEIACPDESVPADPSREELVREVETELEAARRALEEVQRQSQTI